jgi:hypothetical protein
MASVVSRESNFQTGLDVLAGDRALTNVSLCAKFLQFFDHKLTFGAPDRPRRAVGLGGRR